MGDDLDDGSCFVKDFVDISMASQTAEWRRVSCCAKPFWEAALRAQGNHGRVISTDCGQL